MNYHPYIYAQICVRLGIKVRHIVCIASSFSCLTLPVLSGYAAPLETQPPSVAKNPAIFSPLHLTAVQDIDQVHKDIGMAHYEIGNTNALAGTKIEHTFTLRNDNPTSLHLDRIQSSCGCTSAVISTGSTNLGDLPSLVSSVVIAPHQELKVHVTIDPTHLAAGPIEKYVWVYVQGQSDAAAILRMTGTLDAGALFSPSTLDFGKVPVGTTPTQRLTLALDRQWLPAGATPQLVSSDPDVTVTPVTDNASGKGGAASLTASSPETRVYQLSISPHSHLGLLSGVVSLLVAEADGTIKVTNSSVPLHGEVEGGITADPQVIAFGMVTAGQAAVQRVTVTAKSANGLKGMKASSISPFIFAKFVSMVGTRMKHPAANSLTLQISLSPRIPAGTLESQIMVTSADGQQMVLPVSVYTVRPQAQP